MPQNGIHHPGITALAEALAENTHLRILNLNDNTFTKKGSQSIAKVGCSYFKIMPVRFKIMTVMTVRFKIMTVMTVRFKIMTVMTVRFKIMTVSL